MKKLVWTILATAVSTLAAAYAVKALALAWKHVQHEPPPESPKWATALSRLFVRKPVEHAVQP